jgi:hypothetical protein
VDPPLFDDAIEAERAMVLYEMLARGLATRIIRLDWAITHANFEVVKRGQLTGDQAPPSPSY